MSAACEAEEGALRSAAGPRSGLYAHALALLASLLAVGLCVGLLHHLNPRFFFVDDYTAEFYPKMRDIGRMLLAGQMPWQSDRLLLAGNYVLEFQTGIFNPVKWFFAVLSQRFDDALAFTLVYFSCYLALVATAGYAIGAALRLPPWGRVLAAVLCALQPYTLYWQAGGWADPLAGYAWLVTAVAVLIHYAGRSGQAGALPVFFATYMAISAGWPPAIVALGAFAAALCIALWVNGERRQGASLALAFAGGVLFSAPALLSFLLTFAAVAERESSIVNDANFNVVTLQGLLQFSNAAYREFLHTWGGYRLQPYPHFYLAWFVLPVLFFLSGLPDRGRERALIVACLAVAGLFGMLALGPERFTVFRFPSRNLQFYLFFLGIAVLAMMRSARFSFSPARLRALLAVMSLLSLGAAQTAPAMAGAIFAAWLFWVAAVLILVRLWGAGNFAQPGSALTGASGAYLAATSILAILILLQAYSKPRGHDWKVPGDAPVFPNLGLKSNALFFGGYVAPEDYAEFRPATTGAITGMAQFNGYTPSGHRGLRANGLVGIDQGNVGGGMHREFLDGLLRVEPQTGRQMIELLKVDRVIAFKEFREDWLRASPGLVHGEWSGPEEKRRTVVFSRRAYGWPGSVSHAPATLHIEQVQPCPGWSLRECYRVDNRGGPEGRIVFARLWYPGNRIVLDRTETEAGSLNSLLTTATVPAGYVGELTLSYRPPGLRLALAVSAAALFGYSCAGFRRRRAPSGRAPAEGA